MLFSIEAAAVGAYVRRGTCAPTVPFSIDFVAHFDGNSWMI